MKERNRKALRLLGEVVITLVKEWGKRKAGERLSVLQPGEDLRPGAVDPMRAATLLKHGLAVAGEPEAPPLDLAAEGDEPPPKPRRGGKGK